MPSTQLEALQQYGDALAAETRERWNHDQLVAVWNTVAEGATFSQFAMYMTLADRYGLDPFAKEIYFSTNKRGRPMILVGRDGLLKVARRSDNFEKVAGDVVREKDAFKVIHENGEVNVTHSFEGGAEERGKLLGSWAMVKHKDGSYSNFTFCPIGEYFPDGDYSSPWKKQISAMIQKCSVSLALRICYGISGVVGEDEVASDVEGPGTTLTSGEGGAVEAVELPPEVEEVIAWAQDRGHPGYSERAVWEVWASTPIFDLDEKLKEARSALAGMPDVQDAEEVPDELPDLPEVEEPAGRWPSPDEEAEIEALESQIRTLEAHEAVTPQDQEDKDAELDRLDTELRARRDPEQGRLV